MGGLKDGWKKIYRIKSPTRTLSHQASRSSLASSEAGTAIEFEHVGGEFDKDDSAETLEGQRVVKSHHKQPHIAAKVRTFSMSWINHCDNFVST